MFFQNRTNESIFSFHLPLLDMKLPLLVVALLFSSLLYGQEKEEEKAYILKAPDHWRKELIPFPLGFAPSLDYQGLEDIRFSKGWGDKNSEEFWSYKFLWYLDKDPQLTEDKLQKDFAVYFDGIMGAVGSNRGIPADSIVATNTLFVEVEEGVFKGKVVTFDSFFLRNTVTLYFKIKSFYCSKREKHIAYFDISPQSADHRIWDEMEAITIGDHCD